WLAILLALFTTFLSGFLVNLLFGQAYQEASAVLAIQIWGGVFVFIGVASGIFFTAENYTRKVFYRTALGAVSNVLLNIIIIPLYGIYGAALATLTSQFIANVAYDFFDNDVQEILAIKMKSFFPIVYFKRAVNEVFKKS
ncbi:MAG TPA: polysaccharide biosynthesis C-terminal domain-containing protein, partial [Methylotenera sp.]|nr:polysaccharide biosynthesis C-terminal domain-containing protein [Methylotenera sp.]